jgi:hypothetical protein
MIKKIIVEDDAQYVGYVVENEVAVTIGVMPTEEAMNAWLDDAIKRRAWETNSELPDMYNQVN